jgi:hypothetical protein
MPHFSAACGNSGAKLQDRKRLTTGCLFRNSGVIPCFPHAIHSTKQNP